MKKIILLLLTCCFIVFTFGTEDKDFKEFQEYMKKYNKHYDSIEELEKRFKAFKENKRKSNISSMIPSNSPNAARFELNKFADMTEEEFKAKYLTLDAEEIKKIKENAKPINVVPNKKVPKSWDWRDQGAVTPIKDQDSCGSCWAHTTAATLESQYLIHNKKVTSFSVQQLLDCDKGNNACGGGLMNKAYEYLKTHKLMLTEDYPYENKKGECRADESKGVGKVKSYQLLTTDDEEVMKQILYEKGPLAAGLFSFPLMFYSGGIYDPLFGFLCGLPIDHAVTIVGYGEEYGVPYWTVKNSWGEDWGEKGYLRIRRGEGTCSINTFVLWVEADFEE